MKILVDNYLATMNQLQEKAFAEHKKLTGNDRVKWIECCIHIRGNGYVLKKKYIKNEFGRRSNVIWYAVPLAELAKRGKFKATWERVNMRPNDGLPTCMGDCTTRAMAYCLKGESTYREIEREQYQIAKKKNDKLGIHWGDGRVKLHRNTYGVWDKVMLNRGYTWVKFKHTIRRDKLAVLLQDFTYPVITQSSGHVAPVFHGSVIDTWDSRGGRCNSVLVKIADKHFVLSKCK